MKPRSYRLSLEIGKPGREALRCVATGGGDGIIRAERETKTQNAGNEYPGSTHGYPRKLGAPPAGVRVQGMRRTRDAA